LKWVTSNENAAVVVYSYEYLQHDEKGENTSGGCSDIVICFFRGEMRRVCYIEETLCFIINNIKNIAFEPQRRITWFNHEFDNPDVTKMVSLGTIDFAGREGRFNSLKTNVSNDNKLSNFMIFDENGKTVWIVCDSYEKYARLICFIIILSLTLSSCGTCRMSFITSGDSVGKKHAKQILDALSQDNAGEIKKLPRKATLDIPDIHAQIEKAMEFYKGRTMSYDYITVSNKSASVDAEFLSFSISLISACFFMPYLLRKTAISA
jgi:hypothetical protein